MDQSPMERDLLLRHNREGSSFGDRDAQPDSPWLFDCSCVPGVGTRARCRRLRCRIPSQQSWPLCCKRRRGGRSSCRRRRCGLGSAWRCCSRCHRASRWRGGEDRQGLSALLSPEQERCLPPELKALVRTRCYCTPTGCDGGRVNSFGGNSFVPHEQ
jgi:hypothetical protein